MEALSALLEVKSVPVLLILITVGIFAMVIFNIVKFLWGVKKADDNARESTLQNILKEQIKMNHYINNCFFAIKSIAGPKNWEKISKEIRERNKGLDV